MSWFIDDKTRQEIETALGEPLPPPTTEEFRTLMQRLAAENPDLRQRILEALSASPVELPSERHARRLNRQAFIRRLLFGWLRRETFAGDMVWDKRRILASAFGVIAVLLVAMLAVNRATWRPSAAGPHPRQATTRPSTAATPSPAPTNSRPAVRPMPAAATGPVLSAATPTLPQSPSATRVIRGRPAGPRPAQIRPPIGPPPIPDLPGLPVWPSPPTQAVQPPATSASRLIIQQVPERPESSRALIVYEAQPSATSSSAGSPPQGAIVYDRSNQTTAAAPHSTAVIAAPRAGQMTAARLVTALAVVPGAAAMPVVATSDPPAVTWLGDATMGADGLVQITFHTMVGEQTALPVRAIALDAPSRRPGLDAQVKTVARNTAAAVVGAALRATSDYVQALLQQRQVTITNGWATITTGQAPPLWMLFGSRVAEQAAPRGQDAARPMQVAEVSPGTSFTILVLQGGAR